MDENTGSILVVDDEEATIEDLVRILSPLHKVQTARNGMECLDKAIDCVPDLVILDVHLPDITGFEVIKKLKNATATSGVPIIIMTCKDDEEEEETGFALGAVDYIIKPFRDSTVRARAKTHVQIAKQFKTIEKLGLEDPLMGIPNRRRFEEFLDQEWKRALRNKSNLTFMMMDIDKFKDYNDTYGHPQGDTLLKALARLLETFARRPADIVARIGGEEFSIVLSAVSPDIAVATAEKIRTSVEALRIPTADGKTITRTTISIGLTNVVPSLDKSPNDFMKIADEYLYTAKREGRNRVYHDNSKVK